MCINTTKGKAKMNEEQKAARREYFKRYRETHKEQIRQAQRRFYQKKSKEYKEEASGEQKA